jgi:sulfite reductase beta subunit-like hemoprotein
VVTIPLGDFTGQQMRALADLASIYGDGLVRVTQEQDILFRWVRNKDVEELVRRLAATGFALPGARTIADVTSCPGTESCKFAVTQSRGLGDLLGGFLRSRPDLVAAAPDLQIKISGCPNGCGLHHIAGIGFQRGMRKVSTKTVPQYFVMVGGMVDDDAARFGRNGREGPGPAHSGSARASDRTLRRGARGRRPRRRSSSASSYLASSSSWRTSR